MLPVLAFATLTFSQQYPILTDIYVNGQGPFRFLLDTGAQSNVLCPELARRLDLKAAGSVEVATAAGTLLAPLAADVAVMAGAKSASNVEMIWYPLDAVRRVDPGVQGILGQAFLGRFRYRIDYKNRAMELDPPDEPQGVKVPIGWVHGRPALRAADGARWVIDSGAPRLILFRETAMVPAHKNFVAASSAGSAVVRGGVVESLRFEDLELRRIPAVFLPDDSHEEDGLLPASLFRSVYINGRDGYAILSR